MASFERIANNFRLMLAQVVKQLEQTANLLVSPEPRLIRSIRKSEHYVDTQKSMIENQCFEFIAASAGRKELDVDLVRAVSMISSNLERIADFSVNICRQLHHLHDPAVLPQFDASAYMTLLLEGVQLVPDALFERDSTRALRICRIEEEIDALYAQNVRRIIHGLSEHQSAENLVTVLFIHHYLERMGDALLNVGEAILFAILGERLKIGQYRVLDDALAARPVVGQSLAEVELASIWGTRSGERIGTARHADGAEGTRRVLFKEGDPDKLAEEREALQRWHAVAPGLVPDVVEYQRKGDGAALLLQYLDGVTLQDLLLNAAPDVVSVAATRIEETLDSVWLQTRRNAAFRGGFMGQLMARLDDVFRIHPELRGRNERIGELRAPSLAERVGEALSLDDELIAPFTVFGHGDFNIDNIIFDRASDALHFVDVHRSGEQDYVQDVSVFLVSCFRIPVFIPRTRGRLDDAALRFLAFARRFAAKTGDAAFEARLALGLVRSFVSSTRFELKRAFARNMQQRSMLLLNRLLEHRGKPWEDFRVPDDVLVY